MKTILILVDGMRPDSLSVAPYAKTLSEESSYTHDAQTVFPSVTLPCHMSLFHSVDPDRHGVTTNTYTPQVRPISGLCEQLSAAGKTSAFCYNWEQLRDLTRPGSLANSFFCSGHEYTYEKANELVTDEAIKLIKTSQPDFVFLYLGLVDEKGHSNGWMSKEYLEAVKQSWEEIERVKKILPEDYTMIVTADHGGHDRMHGTTEKEDMTIPMFFCGKDFEKGKKLRNVSIKDIAPTIVKITGAIPAREWEGRSIV